MDNDTTCTCFSVNTLAIDPERYHVKRDRDFLPLIFSNSNFLLSLSGCMF